MNKIKFYLVALTIAATTLTSLPSCKKGSDDPAISFRTRDDRFTNTWTLVKYEKNGNVQNTSGSSYIYNIFKNGSLTETIEGSVFGFSARTVKDGTWSFVNDKEDVKITVEGKTTIYDIQRLASKELWLKKNDGTDTHVYYFEGL